MRHPALIAILALLGSSLGLAACTGSIDASEAEQGAPSPDGVVESASCTPDPGPSSMRRLDRFEYDNTVRDLLGDESRPARDFPAEEEAFGFTNNSSLLGMSPVLGEQLMTVAETLAERALPRVSTLAGGCDVAKQGAPTCARAFVQRFGLHAFRRPLEQDEIDAFVALHASGGTFERGARYVISAMLQSPAFLYRIEGNGSTVAPYELASRLSYLLWGSMPDDTLFAAADEGNLATAADVEREARRMVRDPRAQGMVAQFHREWLELERIGEAVKDAAVYPAWNNEVRADQKHETELFLEEVFFRDGRLSSLFTAPYTFVNARLAGLYGVESPAGSGFVKVPVDPTKRMGFLTQGSFLSANAKSNQTSPIHRGKFVREKLLCDLLPPPPNNIVIKPPDVTPDSTTRERFEQHTANPACQGCHRLMDPIGFGFEHFDGIGRYRAVEAGKAVDAKGEIVSTTDADGTFSSVSELANKLARSKQVESCVIVQWFRFAYGRRESEADRCTLEKLRTGFTSGGGDMRELLVQLALTETFRSRRPVAIGDFGVQP